MSMLSAQCDKLRAMAESVGLEVPQVATLMMEAADTIWELRNKCADLVGERERLFRANVEKNNEMLRLVGENARLREERDHWHVEQVHAYGNWEDAHKRAIELEKQNARLQEELSKWERLTAGIDLPEYPVTQFKPKDLERENANLRKQLRDVYVAHRYGLDCTECPWYDECDTEGGCPWLGILRDHLHELGIETDQ